MRGGMMVPMRIGRQGFIVTLTAAFVLGGIGCESSSHVPLAVLPVALAAQPFVLAARAVDENVLYALSNTNFDLAGRVVDEEGKPVDGVTMTVRTWTVTHRSDGHGDQWDQSLRTQTVNGGTFALTPKGVQTVELRFGKPGYFDERLKLRHDRMSSPTFDELDGTGDDCACDAPPPHSYDLNGGGRLIEWERGQRVAALDLRVVLQSRGPYAPVTRFAAAMRFDKAAGRTTVIDLDRPPSEAVAGLNLTEPVPPHGVYLLADRDAGGAPIDRGGGGATRAVSARPAGLRLLFSCPGDGFIPVALGDVHDSRLPFMRTAPAEGYRPVLAVDQFVDSPDRHVRGYLRTEGRVWFFFRSRGRYGCGIATFGPRRNGSAPVDVVLYLQPDGTRNLKAAEEAGARDVVRDAHGRDARATS